MSPHIPPAAAWLESQFDRTVRLRAARDHLRYRLARTTDPHRRATLTVHIQTVTAALIRLGDTE